VELKIGPAHAANEPRAVGCRSGTTDPHRVRRTVIDDCGVISTARRLEADGLRSMYPEGVHRRIAAPSTSHGLPRGGRTPVGKLVEQGFVEAEPATRG